MFFWCKNDFDIIQATTGSYLAPMEEITNEENYY